MRKLRKEADHAETERPGVADVATGVRVDESLFGVDSGAKGNGGREVRVRRQGDSRDGGMRMGFFCRRFYFIARQARA